MTVRGNPILAFVISGRRVSGLRRKDLISTVGGIILVGVVEAESDGGDKHLGCNEEVLQVDIYVYVFKEGRYQYGGYMLR